MTRPVRIVPIVRDRKNALLLRFNNPNGVAEETRVTLQHALIRGTAVEFQLEDGELLGEPLPSRQDRRAILAYEASEGGAGVLHRLIEEPGALNRVARRALDLMHFDGIDEAIEANNPDLLESREGEACVRGCYRCLLSYYNQPDHEMIDRASREVRQQLIDLARGAVFRAATSAATSTGDGWAATFAQHDLCAPDDRPLILADAAFSYVWRSHYIAAKTGPIPDVARAEADKQGWLVFELPTHPSGGLPDGLVDALRN